MIINITNARKELYHLVEEVNKNQEVITITNAKGSNAVLMSEENWKAIQESLYINSVPGYAESLLELANLPKDQFLTEDEVTL